MPYLNLDLNYFEHPKTKRLVGLLGRGAEVLPIKLWSYCGRLHAEDGRLTHYAVQEIETIVGWWGNSGRAVDALVTVGFLSKDGAGYVVHEWNEHQGHIINYHRRGIAAAKARWGDKLTDDATSNAKGNAKTRPKQCPNRTEPTDKPPDPPLPFAEVIPPELRSPEFDAAWLDWAQHRRDKRAPLTKKAAEKQMKKLAGWTVARVVSAIEHSIASGYQGLFEEANGKLPKTSGKAWSNGKYLPG